MSRLLALYPSRFFLALAWLLLAMTSAQAAKLVPDKGEIAVGETVFVKFEADLALLPDWSATQELEILASSGKGATVKGVKAGKGKLTVKYLGGKKSTRINVVTPTGVRQSSDSVPVPPVMAPPLGTGTTVDLPSAPGKVQFATTPVAPTGSYDDFTTALLAKVRSGVNPTDRELLLLMTRPGDVATLADQWRAAGGGAAIDQALALRRAIVQRTIDRLSADAGDDLMAVIALGSWAESLNPGDLDVLMRADPRIANRFNQMIGEEINRIFGHESDDLVRQFLSEGRTFTVETFEIFVSTFEDFGNLQFVALREQAEKLAKDGQIDDAIRLIREQANEIIHKNLRAQSWTAAHTEYYPGVAGQDFIRKYFNTPGKARVWFKSPSGPLTQATGGLSVNQIAPEIIKKMGLAVDQITPFSYQLPVIADEYTLWLKRGRLGAREQAKGLARAYDSLPGWEIFQKLTPEEQNAFRCARILQNVDRESAWLIEHWLQHFGFGDQARFARVGEEALWKLLKHSNDRSIALLENEVANGMRKAAEARLGNKAAQMQAELLRIQHYMASHEQLAALSKLDSITLFNLGQSLPSNLKFREEWKALFELMAEGVERSADDALIMAQRLIRVAFAQGRMSRETGLRGLDALRRGQPLPAEVEEVVAVIRRELTELAAIRSMTPAVESLASCQAILRQWSKNPNSLTLTDEVAELVGELARMGDVALLRLGFKDAEIGLLRQLHQARLAGLNPAKIGERLKAGSPTHWKASLRMMVAIGGTISIYATIKTLSDPNIPEDKIEQTIGETVYSVFPTVGFLMEGGLATDAMLSGYEVDGKALATSFALSVLEIGGLTGPVGATVAAVSLISYGTYAGFTHITETEEDRRFVNALYAAQVNRDTLEAVKVAGGETRSFATRGLAVVPNVGHKSLDILHTPAFVDMYTPRGDVLLDAGPYRKFDTPLRTALRNYVKRNAWDGNKDLAIWETAVRRYFPNIDLDQVESWQLGEVSEQMANAEGKTFKVGAHLVRRYINVRNMLTEATLNQLKTRVADMVNVIRSTDEWRDQLAAMEVELAMEKRIVPNAENEVQSFWEWVKTAAMSNATRIEQIGAIWKRHLKTYGDGLAQYRRWQKIYDEAGLNLRPANELFGLTGLEAEDKARIDKVYVAFQNAYGKAAAEFKDAKGAPYDSQVEFDRDAWSRLINLRLRLFEAELFTTTSARRTQLERDVSALLEEIRAHYAGKPVAQIQVSPSELTEGDAFSASVRIVQGSVPKNARWVWQASGGVQLDSRAGTGVQGQAKQSGTVMARLLDAQDKVILELSSALTVKAKDEGPGGRDYTGGKPGGDQPDTYVPACSYQYSDWGPCNRDTKKQTRTVTGKTPAKCDERQKPVTEQGCTPPPTAEELKHRYLNCLCRCYSGWAGHIGVWYDPEGKSVPECKSNGPCFGGAGAFGCTRRHFFGAPNDCSKSCWEGVYGKDGGYDPDKADKIRLEENKKHKQPLTVTLKASKNPADFGDIVALTAEASEGSGGYRYDWGGCAQDAKDASAKVVNTRQCQACTANVTVTDQDGDAASDSLRIDCTALTVKLSKERPVEDAIPIGGKAELFAEVFSGDQPAAGSFTYYWEPNPDVQYGTDPKNPTYETTGGAQSRNTAIFRQLGRTPVWVTVLKQVGETKMTLGESDQIAIEVVSPSLTLKADKPNPVVGEQVVLTVEEKPTMGDDLITFWWEYQGDAGNPGVHPNTPNSRAWSYKPKNNRPVTVTVHAKAKDTGDELDTASLTLTAQQAEVTVSGPRIAGPAPMIWKEGVGLVAAERQVAEHQRVEFSASVNPAVGDLRYAWRVDPSGCTLHAPYSKDTGVTCSSTGSYTLTVTVKNADGAELGSGSGSLSVSVSQAQIKQGQQKANASKQLDQAKQAWANKNYDQAVSLAESAALIDKGLAQPTLNQFSKGLKEQGWDALNQGARETAIDKLEKAVRLNPNDADAKKKLADARDHVAKWPQVEAKVREFDDHIRNKRIWSAQKTLLAMQDILRTMAAGQSSNNPTWRRVMDDFNTGLQDYNRFTQEKSARHTEYFKSEDYPAMLKNAESMRERELSPADEKECQSRIEFAKRYLQAAEYAKQADALLGQGRYDEALSAVLKGREIHPKSVEAAARNLADAAKHWANDAELKRDFKTSGHLFDLARQAMPQDNDAHRGANNAPVYQKRVDEVRTWQREVEAMIAQGDWDKSEARLEDIKRWEALIPGEMFPETRALLDRQQQGYAAYKAWVEPLKQKVGRYLQHNCLDKARAGIMEMRAKHLIWMDQDWTRVFLDAINEDQRTCSAGGVRLDNDCGRRCAIDGEADPSDLKSALIPVNTLGTVWDKLSAVGGNFDKFARFQGGSLVVDVPAGNGWGKTGLMAKQPMFKIGKTPVTVTVTVDPSRTTGFAVAFAASQHPDVALIDNAWMSWVRNAKGSGDLWLGNVQDAWAGRNKGVSGQTSGQSPASFVFTLEPGRISLQAAGQAPLSVAIGWLKEGVAITPHLFTHPTESGKAASLALTGFQVASGGAGVEGGTGTATLSLEQTRFVQGEPITVRFTAPSTWPRDAWVGIIPSNIPHGDERQNDNHDITYQYLEKRSTGTLTFTAPAPGNWDFRLHDTDGGGKEYASVSFQSVAKGAEMSGTLSGLQAAWIGLDEDKVGDWGNGRPNGTPDGHLSVSLDLSGRTTLKSLAVWGANEAGAKAGGHVWHSQNTGYWMLGVFRDGRQLNASHVASLGEFEGRVALDLYANQSGWFEPGRWILVEAITADGKVLSQAVQVGASGGRDPTGVDTGNAQPTGKVVLEDDTGGYAWNDRTEVQTRKVKNGRAAFRSDGNDHFTHRLGLVGNYPGQYRYLDFWLYFDKPGADLLLQVQVDGSWGKRWGFEAGSRYDGYDWSREGTTLNQPSGQWLRYRLDLIDQLHVQAGQAITGLAFSANDGDVYYDSVYLVPNPSPLPAPAVRPSGKRVLEDDTGGYAWNDATVLQKEVVAHGSAAFRSDGNDHFVQYLGIVGDYPEQFRELSFWVFPIGPEADIQLQVQVDGGWGKRWGFDAGPRYNGYDFAMEGTTPNLKPGVWQELKVDLIRDLKINPGQKITGLAFSANDGDVYYDSVYLHAHPNPAQKPSFQPVGKRVLEDDTGGYAWNDATELQDFLVFNGAKAFRSNGNDHFVANLGVAGSGAGQFRAIGFWAFFMGPKADIQLQVQVNGSWGQRWGFDAGPSYDGYDFAMVGKSVNHPSGRWTWLQLDLIDQLKLKPGDKITGLAFSSNDGDVAYDSVYLLPAGAKPGIGTGSNAPIIPPEPGGRDYTSPTAPTIPVGSVALAPDKTQYSPGETIRLRFSGIARPAAQDWIALYSSGAKTEQYGEWHYLQGKASGELTFKAPANAGQYEFRLMLDWPSGGYVDVARSPALKVGTGTAVGIGQTPAGGSLGPIAGLWSINANNYGGRLGLDDRGSWLNLHGHQEPLQAVHFDGRTLSFTRPISGATQRYTGTRSGNRIEGTFTQQGTSTVYTWFATLSEGARPDTAPATGLAPLKLVDAVPSSNSSAFKRNTRGDLEVNTHGYDRTPYFMTAPREYQLDLSRIDRACLAGNAAGTASLSIDNFILLEVFDSQGAFLKAGTIGAHEGLSRNGQRVAELASGHSHAACAVDLRSFLPTGRPIRLKASAMDYGGVGYASDAWLILAGEGSTRTATGTGTTPASGGPETTFGGHRYRAVLASGGISWAEAERAARALGGYLASVSSPAENDAIYGLVRNDDRFWFIDGAGNGQGPWLGGYQDTGAQEPRGGWRWVSGERFDYSHWAPGEPNNSGGAEHHLQLFGSGTLKGPHWNDIGGESRSVRGYIVEFGDQGRDYTGGNVSAPLPTGSRLAGTRIDFSSARLQGWQGDHARLSTPSQGGPDGKGYLHAFAPGEGVTGYFIAPATLHGDWRGVKALKLAVMSQNGKPAAPYSYGGRGDIHLSNGSKTASYVFPKPVSERWQTFSVPLDSGAGWRLGGGARSLDEVLANVSEFHIRAEYILGDSKAGLAHLEFVGSQPATGQAAQEDPFKKIDEGLKKIDQWLEIFK
ncbi:MAG: hypothetical protein ACOZB0_02515 [Pseudomonadota bacterium]